MNEWTRLVRMIAPAGPAVTLAEAKRHLRVLHDDDDADIAAMVAAAEASIEGPNGIGIALLPQTWRMSLDHFPCEIVVPLGPVTSICSITYTDTDGNSASVSSWRTDFDVQPLRIWPARDMVWPSSVCEPGAVKVTFVCGYAETPADLKAALKLLIGHFYENREAVADGGLSELPLGVAAILERYRVGRVA
ncbi:head-tail connector protein [Sinorhizobium sp. 7-81]|uniref:head-tail connector protein n=1 Tax=Sinorhizobium sp. 8-89 TaxID=3049089 RepID=UPI0024C23643|nr:head-tail connector protein [Sinorhizobium sp. 8-89]MDK1489373.1 head-tail connector protein [Sinorhizobium sp. 8-89]